MIDVSSKLVSLYQKIKPEKEVITKELHPIESNSVGSVCFHLADNCNINCAGCDHFSPLSEPKLEEPGVWENLLARLQYLLPDRINSFSLLGGEPLLNPDILTFCYLTRLYFPKSHIILKTNGTLLYNKEESFYSKLSELDVILRITKYPSIKYDLKLPMHYCIKHEVKLSIKSRSEMFNLSISQTKSNNDSSYYNCDYSGRFANDIVNSNNCDMICDYPCSQIMSNGDFFYCTLPANIKECNRYFNTHFETEAGDRKDYINIFDIDNADSIIYGISHPMPFCKYCDNTDRPLIDWAKSNKCLREWVKD